MSERESAASKRLRHAIAALRAQRPIDERSLETMSAPAFRAVVASRLRALERELSEVRARVNGVLFMVAGAVATQVVLRLFG